MTHYSQHNNPEMITGKQSRSDLNTTIVATPNELYGSHTFDYWENLSKAPEYASIDDKFPLDAAVRHVARVASNDPLDIFLLGVGCSTLELKLISAMRESLKIHSVIIHDLTSEQSDRELAKFQKLFSDVDLKAISGEFFEIDFMNLKTYPEPTSRSLIVMLGGTMANQRPMDEMLEHYSQQMRSGDLLMFDYGAPCESIDPLNRPQTWQQREQQWLSLVGEEVCRNHGLQKEGYRHIIKPDISDQGNIYHYLLESENGPNIELLQIGRYSYEFMHECCYSLDLVIEDVCEYSDGFLAMLVRKI